MDSTECPLCWIEAHAGNPGAKWKIIARHKWVSGATITESELEEDELPPGVTTVYRRFTASVRGWRGFRVFEGRMYPDVVKDVKAKVIEIRDRIEAGDESVFHESPLIQKIGIHTSNPDGTCATIRDVLESECLKAKRIIESTEEYQREDVKVTWPFCDVLNWHFTKCSSDGNPGNPDEDLEEITIIHRLEDTPGNPDGNPDTREIERELAERGIIF